MTVLVNLTRHPIAVMAHLVRYADEVGSHKVVLSPSGEVARVEVTQEDAGLLPTGDGYAVSVVSNTYGEVEGLPDPVPGVAYVVSGRVLSALQDVGSDRTDVYGPDTGPTAVRDDGGHIVAVVRLVAL